MDDAIRLKLLQTASLDLNKDFDQKIGQGCDLRGEEERRRLIYKGLTEQEYHYYFDKLYNQSKHIAINGKPKLHDDQMEPNEKVNKQ